MTTRIHEPEPLITADLARQAERNESLPVETEDSESVFPPNDLDRFRNRWREIQISFVDEPRQSVERADELVGTMIKHLTDVFADERERLERDLSSDPSTEDLRLALRRYHWFFNRLLSV